MKRRRNETVFHSNRANQYSLKRLFDTTKQKIQESHSCQSTFLENRISELDNDLELNLNSQAFGSFHNITNIRKKLLKTTHRLQALDTIIAKKEIQFGLLNSFDSVQSLVFANKILSQPPEIYSLDSDYCKNCHNLFVFDAVNSLNICRICNTVEQVLFHTEDTSADTLILRNQGSGTASSNNNATVFADNTRQSTHCKQTSHVPKVRIPMFRKFLQQFVVDIPRLVFDHLHRMQFAKIHIATFTNCRSTVFAMWLKEKQEFSEFEFCTTRIVTEFCGNRVKLNHTLISQLVQRFEIFALKSIELPSTDRKKIANFDFLVNRFLLMDGYVQLSRCFQLPKTRNVVIECDIRFKQVCTLLGWNNVPRAI